jgi:hypothetical protein
MLYPSKKMKGRKGKKHVEVTPAPAPVLEMCEICGGRLLREHIGEHRAQCVQPEEPAARDLGKSSKPSKSCHCGGMNETYYRTELADQFLAVTGT